MQHFEPLENGKFYHIYNHGVGNRDLFREPGNYEHFLRKYDEYISPIADTYAWVLMPNHFHLLVRIKENVVYRYSNADRSTDPVGFEKVKWQTVEKSTNPTASEGPVGVGGIAGVGGVVECEELVGVGGIAGTGGVVECEGPVGVGCVAGVGGAGDNIPKPHLHFSHLFNAYSRYFNTRYETHGGLFERPFRRKLVDNERYLKQVVLYIHNNPVHHGFCSHPLEYPWSSYLSCISEKPTRLKRELVVGWFGSDTNLRFMHDSKVEVEKIEEYLEM